MEFKDRITKRDDSAFKNFKKVGERGMLSEIEDEGPPSRDIEEGYDPTKRDLGFQKEALEKEVYGEHFMGKKKFVKEKENYYRENQDIEM